MKKRTSDSCKIRVDFIPEGYLPKIESRLGMTLAPGVKDGSFGSFRWERDVERDLRTLRRECKTDILVSLMECFEYKKYGMDGFFEKAQEAGIGVIHAPIVDVNVPKAWEENLFVGLIPDIKTALEAKENVVVHCRGGIGRTGLVVSCVLVAFGHAADKAMQITSKARKTRVPQTDGQRKYVREFARREKWKR